MPKCIHGHDGNNVSYSSPSDEKSHCCGANVTFGDDGLMCKCCFALVEWVL